MPFFSLLLISQGWKDGAQDIFGAIWPEFDAACIVTPPSPTPTAAPFSGLCVHSLCSPPGQRCSSCAAGVLWESEGRMGLEDTPPPSPHQCAKALSVISVKVVVRGRSISKSNCTQRILRSWQKRVECPSPPPHTHTHFTFTLPEAPGEYSSSCQCNVAHRGNHAASLAWGAACSQQKMQL